MPHERIDTQCAFPDIRNPPSPTLRPNLRNRVTRNSLVRLREGSYFRRTRELQKLDLLLLALIRVLGALALEHRPFPRPKAQKVRWPANYPDRYTAATQAS